jgi:PPK2 family polyphosphate:nucleotide phosphotransferase
MDRSIIKQFRRYTRPFRVTDGDKFRLRDFDPADTLDLKAEDKASAKDLVQRGVEGLVEMQDKLYAQDRWAVLLIFQGMDAAGKDGAIKHVMSGVNPQGVSVASFKSPSADELDHEYMWRYEREVPERGRIGIFNRSYYEEVLVVRVHPELLEAQKIPPELIGKGIWEERFKDIRAFERRLARNGVLIRKFFLNVSQSEQKRRLLERLDDPLKNWKYSPSDIKERTAWKDYMGAFEDAIRNTATEEAPWFVVPADHKWFTRLVVAAAVVEAMESLDLRYPVLDAVRQREVVKARRALREQ